MGEHLSWQKIRQAFPKQFVLLKNCDESKRGDVVNILGGEVVESSVDSRQIYHKYRKAKVHANVLFGYTGWKNFEIEEIPFLGIRPAHS